MLLVIVGKTDFIQDHYDRYTDHCKEILLWERERLGSTLNKAWAGGNL